MAHEYFGWVIEMNGYFLTIDYKKRFHFGSLCRAVLFYRRQDALAIARAFHLNMKAVSTRYIKDISIIFYDKEHILDDLIKQVERWESCSKDGVLQWLKEKAQGTSSSPGY